MATSFVQYANANITLLVKLKNIIAIDYKLNTICNICPSDSNYTFPLKLVSNENPSWKAFKVSVGAHRRGTV